MAVRTGDENQARYEQLRRRVLRLHAAAVERDGAVPDEAVPGVEDDCSQTARLDDVADVADVAELVGTGGEDGEEGGEPFSLEPDAVLVAAVRELTDATDELLALGDRLPVLRDVPARAWSLQIVRASALAVLLGAVLLGLGVWREILAVWWTPVILAMLPAAVRMAMLGVAPAAGRHRRQRYAAAFTGAAALLVAPVAAVFGWLPALLCVAVFGTGAAALLELRWGRS